MAGTSGPTTLTTILPGAVFGPVLTKESLGSVRVIQRLLEGRPAGLPRLGFSVVDVRDLADLHIRAMTAPAAAGERFIAVGDFMWMREIAQTLRAALGPRARNVPTGALPDVLVRLLSVFIPALRRFTPDLGRMNRLTSDKARRLLGFSPRPGTSTVVDCAESLARLG
jgi:nucleoside-diphosphate-sugar epimerase